MILPTDTIVAVADGEKLNVFRNTGTETELSLTAAPEEDVEAASGSGGKRFRFRHSRNAELSGPHQQVQ